LGGVAFGIKLKTLHLQKSAHHVSHAHILHLLVCFSDILLLPGAAFDYGPSTSATQEVGIIATMVGLEMKLNERYHFLLIDCQILSYNKNQ
jgi:hypothetical protein